MPEYLFQRGHKLDLRGCIAPLVALAVAALVAIGCSLGAAPAQAQDPARAIDGYGNGRQRQVVSTDMGADPDDQQSMVRQFLYTNEIDLDGIVFTRPEAATLLDAILDAYGQVRANLLEHDSRYPTVEYLRSIVAQGHADGEVDEGGELTAGAKRIISAADKADPRPLWVSIWGGAGTLAEVLHHVRRTRTPAELQAFVSKLRIYSISDQDNLGETLRKEFPDLFYVVSPSRIGSFDDVIRSYGTATWSGISGELFYGTLLLRFGSTERLASVQRGPDTSLVTQAWIKTHIQAKGPMGLVYPDHGGIMEGDTPSTLGLVANGLAAYSNPSWGGWGGRYVFRKPAQGEGSTTETRPFFTQGDGSADTVTGVDGNPWTEDYATIWRWRQAYQWDFSNRMDWTIKDRADANHAPTVNVNGIGGQAPIFISMRPGAAVTLDAAGSSDPDGDQLSYHWFHYPEAGHTLTASSPKVKLSAADGPGITVTPEAAGDAHIILTALDNGGSPDGEPFPMRAYRRIVILASTDAPDAPVQSITPPAALVQSITPPAALPRRCASRRRFAVHLRRPPGFKAKDAVVRIGKQTRRVGARVVGRRVWVIVDLRGLPKGAKRVRVRVRSARGPSINTTRTYRLCAPRRR